VLSYPGAAAHRVVQAKESLGRKWRKIGLSAAAIVIVAVALGIWQFYLRQPAVEPALVEKMAYPLPEKPSIAVLPFDDMSGDPNQDYFCDGLTENMITALSKTPKMFVIARNSTFTYKGKAVKVNQIAEELGVQYVLEGSVRKEGDRVRITAQTGHHLWAEKYDRELKEIFSLQDEITKKIISSLQVKLTEGEQAYVYAKGTDNLEAYLKAMKANWLILNGTKDGILKALDLAEEAVGLEPNYAFANKVLGTAHGVMLWHGLSKNPRETLKRTIELHKKAVELDDSLAIAHAALGTYDSMIRPWPKVNGH
jgi:TolB-like protein